MVTNKGSSGWRAIGDDGRRTVQNVHFIPHFVYFSRRVIDKGPQLIEQNILVVRRSYFVLKLLYKTTYF